MRQVVWRWLGWTAHALGVYVARERRPKGGKRMASLKDGRNRSREIVVVVGEVHGEDSRERDRGLGGVCEGDRTRRARRNAPRGTKRDSMEPDKGEFARRHRS